MSLPPHACPGHRARALAASMLVLWPLLASAQSTPQAPAPAPAGPLQAGPPETGPSDTPLPGAALPPAAALGPPANSWNLAINFQQAYDSNLRFQPEGSQSSLRERLALSLSRIRVTPRSTFTLSAEGSGAVYQEDSNLNTGSFVGGFSGTHLAGPRTTLRGGATVSSSYTPDAAALTGEGLLLPLSRALTEVGSAGISERLGTRTSISADAHIQNVDFSEPAEGLVALQGGTLMSVGASLNPQVGPHDALALAYEFQRSTTGGASGDTQSVTLGWTRVIGTRLNLGASGGGSRYQFLNREGADWAVRAAANIGLRLRRGTVDARYDRAIDQAFGFGRDRLSDVISLGYGTTVGRKLRLRAGGVYGITRDPGDPTFRFTSETASGDLAYTLGRRFDVAVAYSFRHNEPDLRAPASGHAVGLSLGYSREWRP